MLLVGMDSPDMLDAAQRAALAGIAGLHQAEPAAHLEALPFLLACLCDDLDGLLNAASALA